MSRFRKYFMRTQSEDQDQSFPNRIRQEGGSGAKGLPTMYCILYVAKYEIAATNVWFRRYNCKICTICIEQGIISL